MECIYGLQILREVWFVLFCFVLVLFFWYRFLSESRELSFKFLVQNTLVWAYCFF